MANYSVFRIKGGNWAIKKDNAEKASKICDTQKDAETVAKVYCKKSGGGEMRTLDLHWKIRDSDTIKPAVDPFPPRDRVH
jgi:hypothetical protein